MRSNHEKVLVAVDFSEASVDALKQAITIAKKFEAKLLVLHVIHDPANSPGFYISKKAGKKVFRNMEESTRQMMEEFAGKHLKKFKDYGTFVITGLPGAQIINFAEKKKVDLIVMGTHGRGGLDRLILGSVADKVIRGGTCPVPSVRELKSKGKDEQTQEWLTFCLIS